jgi:hypothetical protein
VGLCARHGDAVAAAGGELAGLGIHAHGVVACFLLSPRASCVSGANVVVDGAQNPPGIAGYRARRAARRILPLAVLGSSPAKSTMRGYL